MKVAIIGSGYVGLVAAACFAELGNDVICVDNDAAKLAALQAGCTPIHEQYLPELLARHRGTRLAFSASVTDAVRASAVVFIAVGTPPAESGEADLSYVEAVAHDIAQGLNGYKVIIEKSTVPVYTCEWIRRVITMNTPQAFDVVSNPEFLREGTAVRDFFYPDRIVVGADSPRAAEVLRRLYAPLTSGAYYQAAMVARPEGARVPPPLVVTDSNSAELIKHASNAFLAMKISFINAVANLCDAVGADVQQVREGIGLDLRIGRSFFNPGLGYGGSCFPKDLLAFRAVARESGYDFGLLTEVIKINQEQRRLFIKKIRSALWTLRGKRLGVLGLAFKGGTDDIRESPAMEIVKALVGESCDVCVYDPAATANARACLGDSVRYANTPYEAATGAHALLILTDWDEFSGLDFAQLAAVMKHRLIIDGRNLYDPSTVAASGFMYYSIGRPVAQPEPRLSTVPAARPSTPQGAEHTAQARPEEVSAPQG
ncbi:MAG: UDP-glucose/GDP-mannose dehydrogenase family protein [Acidobacteria bacterium]|nr:UDP-glucose/GDP-mannose dehydrogenase family protein [Acidobacteriota bacterium]